MPGTIGHETSPSTPSVMSTPSRPVTYMRNPSNTSYYSPTVTGNGHQKLNVVTRVAIEGKARKGQDGASIRMFLKISVPIDSVTPGSTIPLFSEENVKIHSSQVHPLDNNSVPYNFSSTVSPMLKNAARALKLPARSQDTFAATFNLPHADGSASSSGDNIPFVDVQYTGQIIVSGYNISYVLPKVFFVHKRDTINEEGNSMSRTPRRRLSIGERNHAQFMAAIDMWVPYASRPPRSPYMLSIPTPRCLHNHIKLRIFPPNNAATSFASLSSIDDDNTVWDLTSDPPVTRSTSSRSPRKSTYAQNLADDESSDSSNISMVEGCEIQGTFPSAESVRVRWAKPLKNLNIPGDDNGRRRVGVEEVKAEMVCIVRGKGSGPTNPEVDGILMDVEYQAHCRGVWFPGVATLLALDVGLEAKGSDITWPAGYATQWEVSGGAGYTGFDNGVDIARTGLSSRSSSLDSDVPVMPSVSRATSSASLLRAPLPAHNMPDYSFEGRGATESSSSGTLPSISSLPASTPVLTPIRPPGSPISLHLNMNELQASVNNSFTFKITGTILVTARTNLLRVNVLNSSNSSNGDRRPDPEPIVLPRFSVLAADMETTTIAIRNTVDSALVEVYHPTGDIRSDPQARKTVLQKGGFTKCGEDGGRMALKYLDAFNMTLNGVNGPTRPVTRPRALSNGMINRSSSNAGARNISTRHRKEGPAIIPSVTVTVTALAPDADMFPTGYAVRVCLQTPTSGDSEYLEFGIAHSNPQSTTSRTNSPPNPHSKVHIICAALDGVAVKSEVTKASKKDTFNTGTGMLFEDMSSTEWICWAKVFCGNSPGCPMVIDYLVKNHNTKPSEEKGAPVEPLQLDLLLPVFFVSIARYEVNIDVMPSLEIAGLSSNFDYHHASTTGNRLLRYSLEEYSQSQLVLTMKRTRSKSSVLPGVWNLVLVVSWAALLLTFLFRSGLGRNSQLHPIENMGFPTQKTHMSESISDFLVTEIPPTLQNANVIQSFESMPQNTASATTLLQYTKPVEPTVYSSVQSSTTVLEPVTVQKPLSPTAITQDDYMIRTVETMPMIEPLQTQPVQDYGLIPVENLYIFDWSAIRSPGVKKALDKVVGTIEVLWNVCRTLYHYPLPPP